MRRSATSSAGRVGHAGADDVGERLEPLVEERVLDAERAHLLDEAEVGRADRGQRQALVGLLGASRPTSTSSALTFSGPILSSLSTMRRVPMTSVMPMPW